MTTTKVNRRRCQARENREFWKICTDSGHSSDPNPLDLDDSEISVFRHC